MGLFDRTFEEFFRFMDHNRNLVRTGHESEVDPDSWPEGRSGNVVLAGDMAVELGNPREGSVAALIWTEEKKSVSPGRISLIGPDLGQCEGQSLSFGKIVLVRVNGFDRDNTYDRYRDMEHVRYDINLDGYMMRCVSQYMREWSRVSRDALSRGFSLNHLGAALITKLTALDFVCAAEVIFVTSGPEHIRTLGSVFEPAGQMIAAMNKMAGEMSFDCDTCDYSDVCDDVAELRQMRNALENPKGQTA